MAKEQISTKDVLDVAKLSRLEFSDNEVEGFKKDLKEIVAYFGVLNEVRTENKNEIKRREGELRADNVTNSLTPAEIVKNAPEKNYNSFIVPKVVE